MASPEGQARPYRALTLVFAMLTWAMCVHAIAQLIQNPPRAHF